MCALIVSTMAACSKTVEWQEEVPLNTGETIWVNRTVDYGIQGAGGNPFDFGYRLQKSEKLSFLWKGRKYIYHGDADLILLAISPEQMPVLIAPAANKNWDWNHDYHCTTPHYVQFAPQEASTGWTWPPKIERWVYGLPTNLLGTRPAIGQTKARYTAVDKAQADAVALLQSPYRRKIEATYTTVNCKH